MDRAAREVEGADLVVLCPFPVGTGNLGNLRLAGRARKLVVLEPSARVPPTVWEVDGTTYELDRRRTLRVGD